MRYPVSSCGMPSRQARRTPTEHGAMAKTRCAKAPGRATGLPACNALALTLYWVHGIPKGRPTGLTAFHRDRPRARERADA